VRADGQKSHTRLSPRASQHHMTKPTGSGDRVNAACLRAITHRQAVVHGQFTLLSREICVPCDRIANPANKAPAYQRLSPDESSLCCSKLQASSIRTDEPDVGALWNCFHSSTSTSPRQGRKSDRPEEAYGKRASRRTETAQRSCAPGNNLKSN
jgi:hypothetical protein